MKNTLQPSTLSALLGSRICHDLVSPIGAISNGVELLQMSGEAQGPEIALIQESVQNANARIRFFRVAFGIAGQEQRIGIGEVREILADLTRGSRLVITWSSEPDLQRTDVKLAFLMIQCLETAMPWGGQISVAQAGEGWSVSGSSERMKEIGPLWDTLLTADPEAEPRPSEVQFVLFKLVLADTGRQLDLTHSEQQVSAKF